MKKVGIRELKSKASDIVHKVAESRATYVITKHGKAVGVLSPVLSDNDPVASTEPARAWNEFFASMELISSDRHPTKSAVRELEKSRR